MGESDEAEKKRAKVRLIGEREGGGKGWGERGRKGWVERGRKGMGREGEKGMGREGDVRKRKGMYWEENP